MDAGVPQTIATPLGDLDFNTWQLADYLRLDDISGADAPDLEREVSDYSGRDGGYVPGANVKAIFPSFDGVLVAQTAPVNVTMRTQVDLIEQKLRSAISADATWRWTPWGANLIANGGGEVDNSGWTAVTGGVVTSDATQFVSGTKSIKLTMTTSAGSGMFSTAVAGQLVAGVTYQVSVQIKRTVGTGNLTLSVKTYDAAHTLLTTTPVTVSPTGAFGPVYTLTFTADATADQYELNLINASGVAQTLYTDNWKVEAGPAVSAYIEQGSAGYTPIRQRVCRVHMLPDFKFVQGRRVAFNFALVCGDPTAYSHFQTTSADILPPAGGAVAVTNYGLLNSYGVIRITGPVTNPTVKNNTSNESIILNALTIAAGAFVDVDCRTGRITLSTDGSSKESGLDLVNSVLFPIYPGVNNLQFTAGTGTTGATKAQAIFRSAWGN